MLTNQQQKRMAMDIVTAVKPDRTEYLRQWHLANRDRRLAANKERRAKDPEKYRAMSRRWKENNPEKYKQVMKEACRKYRITNPDYHRNRNAQWREKNRERYNARARRDYQRRKEKILDYNREYRKNNLSKIAANQREYHAKNAVKRRAQAMELFRREMATTEGRAKRQLSQRKSFQKNKASILARHKAWRAKNPHLAWFYAQRYRALKKKATINLAGIKQWMREIRSKKTAVCYYCQRVTPLSEIHFDHIVALSKGGAHSVENLCVSCETCNLQKGSKPIRAWVKIGQQTLEL